MWPEESMIKEKDGVAKIQIADVQNISNLILPHFPER